MNALASLLLAATLTEPVTPASSLGPLPEEPALVGASLRERGVTHPRTRFVTRSRSAAKGRLLTLRESVSGVPVAGARLALRVDAQGVVRRVVGRALSPDTVLPDAAAQARAQRRRAEGARLLWWPRGRALRLARVEDGPLRWSRGAPEQTRRYLDDETGEELARESLVDEVEVPLAGWLENPVTTPVVELFDVALRDQDPIALEDDVFRVLQCNWSEELEDCDPLALPTADVPEGFPNDLPDVSDAEGHASWDDPYAATQLAQHASRFIDELVVWGWDTFAWDEIDCSGQEVEPEDCRLLMHANVLRQDEAGVFAFVGAFYSRSRGIFMGQGNNADTSYDGDIVVHEIGHHVVWSYGAAEPIDLPNDGARRRVDWGALNEGSADVFANLMGQNERVYDYFSQVEPGIYVDNRVRDVSIPFRCPENIVGEVHMEGRIWVSAIYSIRAELEDAGLADRDAFGAAWLTALGLIRHIPREYGELFADSAAILVEEIEAALGEEAGAIAQRVVDERGLSSCDHVLDLHDEAALPEERDDPLDARFMVFTSHKTNVEPEVVDASPFAPALQHRVTLGPDEGGLRVRAKPTLWRPDRPVDEVGFRLGLLARAGADGVAFTRDPETKLSSNNAELRFESDEIDEDGWIEVRATGLTPGETYSVALVSLSAVDGELYVIEQIRWEVLGADADGDSVDVGTDSDGAGEGGCGCAASEDAPSWWSFALLPALLGWRRRRAERA